MVEDRRVAARLPAAGGGSEPQLLSVAPGDRLVPLPPQRDVSTNSHTVEPARELRRVDARARQEVDLAGAVRRRHDDLAVEPAERRMQLAGAVDVRLAVIGVEHDRVALEKRVRPTRRVEQRGDRRVGALECDVVGAGRTVRVRREVEVGEVVREEVEAVARDEPAVRPPRRTRRGSRPRGCGRRAAPRSDPTRTGCRRRTASARTRASSPTAAWANDACARGSR